MAADGDDRECRFCLELEPAHELIHPCQCRGSSKFIHRSCLNTWRLENRNGSFLRCTECHYVYRTSRVWWGQVVSHWLPSATLAVVSVTGIGALAGFGSAWAYNSLYYFWHALPYMSPHRLQVLYHSVCWVGVPGLCLGAGTLLSAVHPIPSPADRTGDAVVEMIRWYGRPPATVHHHHHYDREEKKSEHSDEDSDDEERKVAPSHTKVAPYEPKSTSMWLCMGLGVVASFYFSYRWVYQKARAWGMTAQEQIENVGP